MAKQASKVEVHLGPQGRMVIPAFLRRAMGVGSGDRLLAHLEDDRLVLEKTESVKIRLKARFAHVRKGRSLAKELIADRREEAKKELAE
ncbi:MAG: AbrB/MazE/SpoVT family DNA-binding domain-containing protein [Nitrospinae bacterium]|nr:AbrB/MazE/SpoVT family DNA-binding domain-containing protein [Nitrospinota bacterium]